MDIPRTFSITKIKIMEQNTSLFEMNITAESRSHLSDTAKWAKFLAICGMIFIVLLIIFGIVISLGIANSASKIDEIYQKEGVAISSKGLSATMMVMYILMGLLYFFPCLFTLQFANKMKLALASNDSLLLSESFRSLKKTFRYLGILTIIGLAFLLLVLVTGGLATMMN